MATKGTANCFAIDEWRPKFSIDVWAGLSNVNRSVTSVLAGETRRASIFFFAFYFLAAHKFWSRPMSRCKKRVNLIWLSKRVDFFIFTETYLISNVL